MTPPEIADIFSRYHEGKLSSFLLEIAGPVLRQGCAPGQDDGCLILKIADIASEKGTGRWASIDALERGVATPTITEAVFARYLSREKEERTLLGTLYRSTHRRPKQSAAQFVALLEEALYAAMISTFAQGFALIARASREERWDARLSDVARIWQGGCIIRAKMLGPFSHAYKESKKRDAHLFALPMIVPMVRHSLPKLRELLVMVTPSGLPLAGFASALFYLEAMREPQGPSHLIQELRDYFGRHGFARVDRPGLFHGKWTDEK